MARIPGRVSEANRNSLPFPKNQLFFFFIFVFCKNGTTKKLAEIRASPETLPKPWYFSFFWIFIFIFCKLTSEKLEISRNWQSFGWYNSASIWPGFRARSRQSLALSTILARVRFTLSTKSPLCGQNALSTKLARVRRALSTKRLLCAQNALSTKLASVRWALRSGLRALRSHLQTLYSEL